VGTLQRSTLHAALCITAAERDETRTAENWGQAQTAASVATRQLMFLYNIDALRYFANIFLTKRVSVYSILNWLILLFFVPLFS